MATLVLTVALLLPAPPVSHSQLRTVADQWDETHPYRFDKTSPVSAYKPTFAAAVSPSPIPSAAAAAIPPPTPDGWRPLVAHFWPAEHVDRMLRIVQCESHGDPSAVNPSSGAAGLFQVMPFWQKVWPGDDFDPWTNAAVAYQIWLSQGYGAWVCKG